MKRTMTIGLLGAILAVAVGFVSTNAISATPFLIAGNQASPSESAFMIGHVEYTVRDANGQIKQYAQGDNDIVERGTDCTAQRIFNGSDNSGTGSSVCSFTLPTAASGGFQFIAIGNDTTVSALGGKTQLDTAAGGEEMDRTKGSVSIATASGSGSTVATISTIDAFTFETLGVAGSTVTQSGLFDDSADVSGNMFAMRDSLGIQVLPADTLSVTWKITLKQGP